jgi:hypothetical protein
MRERLAGHGFADLNRLLVVSAPAS